MKPEKLKELRQDLLDYAAFLRKQREDKMAMVEREENMGVFMQITSNLIDLQRDIDTVEYAVRIITRRILNEE